MSPPIEGSAGACVPAAMVAMALRFAAGRRLPCHATRRSAAVVGQRGAEQLARALPGEAELAVRGGEMGLHRLDRDEQLLCDLGVAHPGCGERGDALLARGERVEAAEREPPRAAARG